MTNLDTLARTSAAQLHASVASAAPPRIDPGQPTRYPPGRMRALTLAGLAVVVIGAIVVFNLLTRQEEPIDVLPGPVGELAFHPTGDLSAACASCSTLLLSDGNVMVFNWVRTGQRSGEMSVELFDPETWRFSRLETIDERPGLAVELPDGRVLLLSRSFSSVTGWLIDPDRRSATRAGSGLERWSNGVSSMLLLDDGRLLLHGTGRLAYFDPSDGTFTQIDLVGGAHLVPLPDGSVFIPNSTSGGTVFDPSTDTLERVGSPGPPGVLVAELGDGQHLIVNPTSGQAGLFDPSDLTFESIESVPSGVWSLIEIGDGSVLVVPAFDSEDYDPYMGSAVGGQLGPWTVFDPATESFVAIDERIDLSHFVRDPARLSDGRLLFFTAAAGQTAIFDPATRRFEPGPGIASARVPRAIQSFEDGRVLMIGDNNPLSMFTDPSFGSEVQRLFTERERSAEMLVEGGSTLPSGCCPEAVGGGSYFKIQTEVPISEEQAALVASGGLELVLTAPPGALDGAIEIAYRAGFWNSDYMPGAVPNSEGPDRIVKAPEDCAGGCRFPLPPLGAFGDPIPISGNPRLGLISNWEEYVDRATATLTIVYRSALPAGTDQITVSIDN